VSVAVHRARLSTRISDRVIPLQHQLYFTYTIPGALSDEEYASAKQRVLAGA
jgi:hypothetical protein